VGGRSGTTYRFAKEDRRRFPDIRQAGAPDQPYHTNSSQLPAGFTDAPSETLARQEERQRKYTGGTVLHLYLGERVSSARTCREVVRRALTRFSLPYITVTPTFSVCPSHGYLDGEREACPTCADEGREQACEVWTRGMGYYCPVRQWYKGKKAEHADRLTYSSIDCRTIRELRVCPERRKGLKNGRPWANRGLFSLFSKKGLSMGAICRA
jgi:ribonucleoside-triphosphate reductase